MFACGWELEVNGSVLALRDGQTRGVAWERVPERTIARLVAAKREVEGHMYGLEHPDVPDVAAIIAAVVRVGGGDTGGAAGPGGSAAVEAVAAAAEHAHDDKHGKRGKNGHTCHKHGHGGGHGHKHRQSERLGSGGAGSSAYTQQGGIVGVEMDVWIACLETALMYTRNVLQAPTADKFRRIATANAAFQRRVGMVAGGVELMVALGWREVRSSPRLLNLKSRAIIVSRARPKSYSHFAFGRLCVLA